MFIFFITKLLFQRYDIFSLSKIVKTLITAPLVTLSGGNYHTQISAILPYDIYLFSIERLLIFQLRLRMSWFKTNKTLQLKRSSIHGHPGEISIFTIFLFELFMNHDIHFFDADAWHLLFTVHSALYQISLFEKIFRV